MPHRQKRDREVLARAEELLDRFPIPRPEPYIVAFRLLLSPVIYLLMIGFVYLVYPDRLAETVTRTLGDFVIGKFSAVGAASPGDGQFLYWVVMIGSVELLTGLFLVWNFDLLYRVPWLGPLLRVMEAKGKLFLQSNSWVRRVAFTGVILIVIVPFQGTGAVMGSIVGRLIGLGPWRALVAIGIGGYVGVVLMLSASILVAMLHGVNPWIGVGAVAVLLVAGFGVWWQWFRVRRHSPADAQEPESTAETTEP